MAKKVYLDGKLFMTVSNVVTDKEIQDLIKDKVVIKNDEKDNK